MQRETAPPRADQLPRYHPPRDRVPRPRRGGGQRRQRDRQVVDDRGARPAAATPRTGRTRRKSSRSSRPTPTSAPRSPPRSPPALTDSSTTSGSTSAAETRADGAGAAPRAAHRRRGARTGARACSTRPSTWPCGRRSGCCSGVHRGGGPVGMRRTVAGARRGGGRGRPAVRGRATADRPHRRRVPALLTRRPAVPPASGRPPSSGCATPMTRSPGVRPRSRRSTTLCAGTRR